MRKIWMALAALLATGASSQAAPPAGGPITCAAPVVPGETLASLKGRFGKDAAQQNLPGAEGAETSGLLLYPKAQDQQIEVGFGDEGATGPAAKATGLTLRDTAGKSRWTIAGLTIGSSVADVQKANGKSFLIAGFGWDYGGFAVDWKGGALSRPLPGGCTITVRFNKEDAPNALSGDGRKIASDNAALAKWAPTVSEISVDFPQK